MIQLTPVILCGGSGTRLWPLLRTGFPKQFLCLTGNESLFQQAAQRLTALGNDSIQVAAAVIVSGEDHRFLDSEQLREVGIALGTTLHEPAGRNSAPALTLAALSAVQDGQPRVGCYPRRPNHRQARRIHRRRTTSHCPSRARQHRHLGRYSRQTRNRLRLHQDIICHSREGGKSIPRKLSFPRTRETIPSTSWPS